MSQAPPTTNGALAHETTPEPLWTPEKVSQWRDAGENAIADARDDLFLKGSDFKPAYRDEIIGIDNVLNELDEIIHWLRHSKLYQAHGSRLEPGIILAGLPGTGKTTSARYIATESEAFFVNVRDFAHAGELLNDADIRDLFHRARQRYSETGKPVVLFWDEFEGVAVERSGDKTTPGQAAVVSQLTSELEGALGKNEGILLIGCTNYLNTIDHALRRSGRLGVSFEFHAPDRKGKEKILGHFLGKMGHDSAIDVETLSHFFDKRATAADIEESVMEAWRNAVRRAIENDMQFPTVNQDDLIKVFIKRLVGPPPTYTVPEEERLRIAIHEIGHAIVALAYGVKVRLITVQPGRRSLGRVMTDDLMEYIANKDEVLDFIRVGAGGIASERAAGLPEMVGSTGDISMMNRKAIQLIDFMGYDDSIGLFNVGEMGSRSSEVSHGPMPSTAEASIAQSDKAVQALLRRVQEEAHFVMRNIGTTQLWELAERVNERVTMTGNEFEALLVEVTGKQPEEFRV
jgi:ATP-dependent Zn protease